MKKFSTVVAILTLLSACTPDKEVAVGIATGMLQTRDYIITMYTGSQGPLYSVRGLDGTLLDEDISMETMVARYPTLNYLKDNDNIDWAGLDGSQLYQGQNTDRR